MRTDVCLLIQAIGARIVCPFIRSCDRNNHLPGYGHIDLHSLMGPMCSFRVKEQALSQMCERLKEKEIERRFLNFLLPAVLYCPSQTCTLPRTLDAERLLAICSVWPSILNLNLSHKERSRNQNMVVSAPLCPQKAQEASL